MNGPELRQARHRLGMDWGFGRPLHLEEMAAALRLGGERPDRSLRDYEKRAEVSGPISALVDLYLGGSLPPDGIPGKEHA